MININIKYDTTHYEVNSLWCDGGSNAVYVVTCSNDILYLIAVACRRWLTFQHQGGAKYIFGD